jgi:peptide/nickel transport system substrate-binding protein
MPTTRRSLIAAAAASLALPAIGRAQPAPSAARTLKAVMHADLRVFDPHWTTANITSYHGAMVYDTLFGVDADFNPQPQMLAKHGVSEDGKTYTFELRDGLAFSDGAAVTAADCVASIRRWGARDGSGQHMLARVADTPVVDDKTFRIVLREPYGLVIDALSKISASCCFIMRRKEAETDPNAQVREIVGSGPFLFNRDQTKPGAQYVYDRNPAYRPRGEPISGMSGGKVVKLDRVIYQNMPDETTAMAALRAGEIDFYEVPPQDLIGELESDPNLVVQALNKTGHLGWLRPNFLHPPFDNVKARQALLHLINQSDIMRAAFGQSDRWKPCGAYFGCGTTMENDEGTDWLKTAPDLNKARQLFKEAGYNGEKVVILHATDHYLANPAGQLIAQWLRQVGVNAELASSDWGTTLTRRAVRKPVAEGGWNIFITASTSYSLSSPVGNTGHAANGEKAWFGWPTNPKIEAMRDEWAAAPTLAGRQAVARRMQKEAWEFGQHMYLGQFFRASAWRKTVSGVIGMPELVPFWNIEKKA